MPSIYEEVEKEMGLESNMGEFINLKAGSTPIVAKLVKIESSPCTDKEMEKSQYGEGYAFCRPNGKTFVYSFESLLDGEPKVMRSHKDSIFWSFKKTNALPGDVVKVERVGSTKEDTRYIVTKLSEAEAKDWVESRKKELKDIEEIMGPGPTDKPLPNQEELKIEDIPF